MRLFRPVLAVDIETTGLNSKECAIIEIAMIFDDLGTYGGIKKELNLLINPENGLWEEGAREFHSKQPKSKEDEKIYSQKEAKMIVQDFLSECHDICGHSLNIAGKRATDLIYPFLRDQGYVLDEYIYHQHIDVPTLFFIEFRGLLPLYKIAKYYNIEHDGSAMSDARLSHQLLLNKIEKELF